jgi:signal peptidase II
VTGHEHELLGRLPTGLAAVPGLTELRLFDEEGGRTGTVGFVLEGIEPGWLAAVLSAEYGIGVRDGAFCAHIATQRLVGRTGSGGRQALRVSLGLGTTAEHVDRLVTALQRIVARGSRGPTPAPTAGGGRCRTRAGSRRSSPADRAWAPRRTPLVGDMDNGCVSTEQGSQPEAAASEPASQLPKRRVILLAVVAVLALALDVSTKAFVASSLAGREPVRILGGLVYLQLVRNPGAAFSMATGMTWVLALVAIGVVVTLIWFAGRLRSIGWAIGLGLVLAGALGNLVDRIFRAPGPLRGYVVDFISVFAPNGEAFPVFNVADSCICVGGALIVLLSLLGREYDGSVRSAGK